MSRSSEEMNTFESRLSAIYTHFFTEYFRIYQNSMNAGKVPSFNDLGKLRNHFIESINSLSFEEDEEQIEKLIQRKKSEEWIDFFFLDRTFALQAAERTDPIYADVISTLLDILVNLQKTIPSDVAKSYVFRLKELAAKGLSRQKSAAFAQNIPAISIPIETPVADPREQLQLMKQQEVVRIAHEELKRLENYMIAEAGNGIKLNLKVPNPIIPKHLNTSYKLYTRLQSMLKSIGQDDTRQESLEKLQTELPQIQLQVDGIVTHHHWIQLYTMSWTQEKRETYRVIIAQIRTTRERLNQCLYSLSALSAPIPSQLKEFKKKIELLQTQLDQVYFDVPINPESLESVQAINDISFYSRHYADISRMLSNNPFIQGHIEELVGVIEQINAISQLGEKLVNHRREKSLIYTPTESTLLKSIAKKRKKLFERLISLNDKFMSAPAEREKPLVDEPTTVADDTLLADELVTDSDDAAEDVAVSSTQFTTENIVQHLEQTTDLTVEDIIRTIHHPGIQLNAQIIHAAFKALNAVLSSASDEEKEVAQRNIHDALLDKLSTLSDEEAKLIISELVSILSLENEIVLIAKYLQKESVSKNISANVYSKMCESYATNNAQPVRWVSYLQAIKIIGHSLSFNPEYNLISFLKKLSKSVDIDILYAIVVFPFEMSNKSSALWKVSLSTALRMLQDENVLQQVTKKTIKNITTINLIYERE